MYLLFRFLHDPMPLWHLTSRPFVRPRHPQCSLLSSRTESCVRLSRTNATAHEYPAHTWPSNLLQSGVLVVSATTSMSFSLQLPRVRAPRFLAALGVAGILYLFIWSSDIHLRQASLIPAKEDADVAILLVSVFFPLTNSKHSLSKTTPAGSGSTYRRSGPTSTSSRPQKLRA